MTFHDFEFSMNVLYVSALRNLSSNLNNYNFKIKIHITNSTSKLQISKLDWINLLIKTIQRAHPL